MSGVPAASFGLRHQGHPRPVTVEDCHRCAKREGRAKAEAAARNKRWLAANMGIPVRSQPRQSKHFRGKRWRTS